MIDTIDHKSGCTRPPLRIYLELIRCPGCRRGAPRSDATDAPEPITAPPRRDPYTERPAFSHSEGAPVSVYWPSLMALAERKRIPVLRIDHVGGTHLLRTVADLDEWDD